MEKYADDPVCPTFAYKAQKVKFLIPLAVGIISKEVITKAITNVKDATFYRRVKRIGDIWDKTSNRKGTAGAKVLCRTVRYVTEFRDGTSNTLFGLR